jgi:hypothetical protein
LDSVSEEQGAADGRLIAAAPELLEVLIELQQHVIRHACSWDDSDNGTHHHPVWARTANVIAKATGAA